MSHVTVHTGMVSGLSVYPFTVEADSPSSTGEPGIHLTTAYRYADTDAMLSDVLAALKGAGYDIPSDLSVGVSVPRDLGPIEEHSLDLPVALAILAASGLAPIQPTDLENAFVVGKLDNKGQVLPARGLLVIEDYLREDNAYRRIDRQWRLTDYTTLPSLAEDPGWANLSKPRDLSQLPTRSCDDTVAPDITASSREIAQQWFHDEASVHPPHLTQPMLLAALCAAVGGHSIAGYGTYADEHLSFLPLIINAIRPDMTKGERHAVDLICSATDGNYPYGRPFRTMYKDMTANDLTGDSGCYKPYVPGEFTRATHGSLFTPYFDWHKSARDVDIRERDSHESLPWWVTLDVGHVRTNHGVETLPSDFCLVSAMRQPEDIPAFFDIQLDTEARPDLGLGNLTFDSMREMVDAALAFRAAREEREAAAGTSWTRPLYRHVSPERKGSYHAVSRTLADLDGSQKVTYRHGEMAYALLGLPNARWPRDYGPAVIDLERDQSPLTRHLASPHR